MTTAPGPWRRGNPKGGQRRTYNGHGQSRGGEGINGQRTHRRVHHEMMLLFANGLNSGEVAHSGTNTWSASSES